MRSFIAFLLTAILLSCDSESKINPKTENQTALLPNQYSIFHKKLLITSPVKPQESDSRNSITETDLGLYTDIKRYTFIQMINKGEISITVAEFKAPENLYPKPILEAMLEGYRSEFSAADFKEPARINNKDFDGYHSSGRINTKDAVNPYIYLGIATGNKMMMTLVAEYKKVEDEKLINELVQSIELNKK